jgi:hypothetical protein
MFAAIFIVACGALAVWLCVRFPAWEPRSVRGALAHVAISLIAFYVAVPELKPLVRELGQPLAVNLTIFGLLLPAFVYRLLSSIWILKIATSALGGRLR